MVQDPLETAADSSNGSTGTPAHVTAQVVVNTTHSGQHTLVDSDAASTSAGTIVSGSPHYITVTGNSHEFINFLPDSEAVRIDPYLILLQCAQKLRTITLQTVTHCR